MRYILTGVETRNKGAELMLYAILQQIEKRDPQAEVFMRMSAVPQGFDYVKTNVKLCEKPYKKQFLLARKWKIVSILSRLGIKTVPYFSDARAVKDIDYVLDGSGFWFTDQWKLEEAEVQMWEVMLHNYRKQGSRIVFLPQAFGPIELDSTKKVINSIAFNSDLIMPRELVSYDYMKAAGVPESKMMIYPDFTSLVEGVVPQGYAHLKDGVCVIPNMRMIDKGTVSFENYIDVLKTIIRKVQTHGKVVYLLNHEGKQDEQLAYRCQKELGESIEVVTGLNGLEVKGLISTASLCVTSRFHGVASALNSCVPCLATSWSHKYEELFKDYGQKDCVLNLSDMTAIENKVSEFLNPDTNKYIQQSLKEVLPAIRQKSEEMWDLVWNRRITPPIVSK